jgi:hypothetical protein
MRKFLFLLALIFLLGAKCNKEPVSNQTLPPATQEGKNTVGFTINGEVWVPYAKCGFGQDPCREISARYGALGGAAPKGIDFQFTRVTGNKSSTLTISSALIGTVSTQGDKTDSIGVDFQSENWNGGSGIFAGPLLGSKFMITKIDFQDQIISGEFELTLIEQNGSGKTIVLKDGRFDFKFNACKCSN